MRAALAALLLALVLLPGRALAADRINGELSIVTDQGFTRLIFASTRGNVDPGNPPQFPGLTPVWRRTSWNELINNL